MSTPTITHRHGGGSATLSSFLALVQAEPCCDERIELRYNQPGTRGFQRHWHTDCAAFADDARALARRFNVHYGVALRRRGGRGTAADCTRAGALWADIDAKLFESGDALAAALAAIEAFHLPASALICSGNGYQPYWRLEGAVDVQDHGVRLRVEQLNKALARAVCGPERAPDHVHNVDRILRVPGTLNHKSSPPRAVEVVWLRPEQSYTLEGIRAALKRSAPWALLSTPGTAPERTAHQWAPCPAAAQGLWERAAQGRIRRTTLALLDSTGAAGYKSASEADMAIAAGLVSAGLTMDEALALVLARARGRDAIERKGEGHGLAYWQLTIKHAAELVGVTTASHLRPRRPDLSVLRACPPNLHEVCGHTYDTEAQRCRRH